MNYLSVCIILVTAVLSACKPPAPVKAPEGAVEAAPAIDKVDLGRVIAKRVDGLGEVRLGDFKGQSLLLHFFAPWTDSGAQVADALRLLETTGLKVLPVVVDERGMSARPALTLEGWSGLQAVDGNEQFINAAGGLRALPTTVLLGADGKLAKTWPGHVAISNIIAGLQTSAAATP
jgi:hypothetical protein